MPQLPPEVAQTVLGLLGHSALVVAVLDTTIGWGERMRRKHWLGIGVNVGTADIDRLPAADMAPPAMLAALYDAQRAGRDRVAVTAKASQAV